MRTVLSKVASDSGVEPQAESASFPAKSWRTGSRFEDFVYRSAQIFLIVWGICYLIRGTFAALWFDGPPADGPFQIFNPLRRIAAGQTPGVDFQFYHGIGVPYLHYPLFALFGKSINASELARQLTSFLLFAAVLALFTWLVTRSIRWSTIAGAVTVVVLEAAFRLEAAGPGNSQIGVRSTLPIFAIAALTAGVNPTVKAILFGCGLAASLVCGFEQGIALVLGLFAVYVLSLVLPLFQHAASKGLSRANTRFVALALGSGAVAFILIMMTLGGVKGMLGALHYNLVELPADQFWYDGIPPNPYLGTWSDLVSSRSFILPLLPLVAGAIILFAVVMRMGRNLRIGNDWQTLAAIMLVYGVASNVSLLGMYSKHYTFPMCRILLLVSILILARNPATLWRLRNLAARYRKASIALACVALVVFLAGSLALAYSVTRNSAPLVSSGAASHHYLGTRWSRYMQGLTTLLDSRSNRRPISLWSTYAGLPESYYGIFHPTDDYLSLAVAQRRNNYFREFRNSQPQFVQTVWPGYFPYEEWLQNVNWAFYEDLINNYEMLGRVDFGVIWQRRTEPWVAPAQNFEDLRINGGSVEVPGGLDGTSVRVIKLSYRIHNPWEHLPVIGLTPRYLITPEGTPRHNPIGLPQYKSEVEFPLDVLARGARLRFETRSLLPGAYFVVDRVQMKRLPWRRELLPVLSPEQVNWESFTFAGAPAL